MATTSIIVAAMDLFDSLTAANFPNASRPAIYLDQAPLTDGAGAQVYPPYVVLRDNGQTPTIVGFERTGLEVCQFALEVYYPSAADVAAAIWAIRLNGGTVGQGLGFDYGTLATLSAPRSSYQVLRGKIQYRQSGVGKDGKPVYVGTVEYKVTAKETP